MKVIVCELCGNQEFKKVDGMFVCEQCGTKYSVEDAQKLMVELNGSSNSSSGNSGSNKKLSNLYERARKSLEVDDLEHAAEYYMQILDENPNDWEAYFYAYLGEYTSFTNGQAAGVASKLGSTIPAAYDMAAQTEDKEAIAERVGVISEGVADRLAGIASTAAALLEEYEGGNILFTEGRVRIDMYKNLRPTAQDTIVSAVLAFDPIVESLEDVYKAGKISREVYEENALHLLRVKYNIANLTFEASAGVNEKMVKDEAIREFAQQINALDPDFEVPEETAEEESSGGGCYVATAVYGSYDCPQVWTLRRFRDNTLAESFLGRLFIRLYYACSPTIVKWFGNTAWFKNLWKKPLDRMVQKLNREGVEDTPYRDRRW